MNTQEKLTNAILQKRKELELDHLTYISNKEKTTIKLFEEQMLKGKKFGRTTFDKLDDLKESVTDL